MAFITAYWSLDGIAVLVTFITLFYLYMTRKFKFWKKQGILEAVPPTFFFGNFANCLRFKKAPAEFLKEFYDQAKGLPFVGFYILDQPALLICDQELVKNVLVKDFNYFNDRYVIADPKDRLNYANLFFIKNPDWKILRAKLSPFFTSGRMKKMFHLMLQCGKHLDEYLDSPEFEGNGKTIEIKELSIKFTTDIIGIAAFGLEVNSFKDPNAEFCKYSKMLFRFSIIRAYEMLAIFFMPNIVRLFGIKMFGEEPTKFLRKAFWKTITARIKSGEKRYDLIDMLIELKQNPDNMLKDFSYDGDDLIAQAANFFSAGSDTSATALSFTLYALAIRPEMQDKLRKEILEGLDVSDGKITYNMTMSLPYLDMVISETLRMYPPLGYINRMIMKTYKVPNSNIVLEKGTPVYISILGMHYDPKYFPNPNEFNPERFNEKDKRNRPSCVYFPFGEGPHMCIGMRFAMLQTKLGLIQILSKYGVTCEKTEIPVRIDTRGALLAAANGIYLNVRRINNVKI